MPNAEAIAREIANEFYRACTRFPQFNSGHEGYAVILEEMDELWTEVKDNKRDYLTRRRDMRAEAIQVGAMALRFIYDLCDGGNENPSEVASEESAIKERLIHDLIEPLFDKPENAG